MKVYHVSFPAGWVGGDAIITAETPERAVMIANESIPQSMRVSWGPGSDKQPYQFDAGDLTEIDLAVEQVTIVNDGDY